jgi:hypothetical protein
LNQEEGNPVNDDGTDLDLIPFLTSSVEDIIPELPTGLLLILMSMFVGVIVIRKKVLKSQKNCFP